MFALPLRGAPPLYTIIVIKNFSSKGRTSFTLGYEALIQAVSNHDSNTNLETHSLLLFSFFVTIVFGLVVGRWSLVNKHNGDS